MPILNPLSDAFGIDIGDRSFKLAQVRKRAGRPYQLLAWGSIDVPEAFLEHGTIKDSDKAAEYLVRLINEAGGRVRGRAVVACLPEAKTFVKIIELEAGTGQEALRQAVLKEIDQNIPLPASEIYYDWQVVDDGRRVAQPAATVAQTTPASAPAQEAAPATEDEKKGTETPTEPVAADPVPEEPTTPVMRVLMGAAPKTLVDEYTVLLEKAGLVPIAFEIEAMAIARALVTAKDDLRGEPLGIIDIGATRSSLVVYDNGAIRMSISVPISGIAITKLVSDSLGVGMDDAETLKRECGLDASRCEDKMWNILLPLIDDMTEKVRNALRFYRLGFPEGKKIERLVLSGGGAQFREIDSVLSRKLTLKVRKGDALGNIDPRLPKGFPHGETALTYTALGPAMRAADEFDRSRSPL